MIFGVGCDIIEIERVRKTLGRTPAVLQRIFTEKERAYCENKIDPFPSLAVRFAAKEAVFKALGGKISLFSWRDISVINEQGGQPQIELSGAAWELASRLGISQVQISLSHSDGMALAFAVAIGGGNE